jgi:hypothetical protein
MSKTSKKTILLRGMIPLICLTLLLKFLRPASGADIKR